MTKLDWIYPPEGATVVSLSSCLHDAHLEHLSTDALERTATIRFNAYYVVKHMGLDENVRIFFTFDGVKSARLAKWFDWPGPIPDQKGLTREEGSKAINEYSSKGHFQSVDWDIVICNLQEYPFDVYSPDLLRDDTCVALRLTGRIDDEWHLLWIAAERLTVTRSDGEPFSLEQFIAAGKSYWDNSRKR